MSNEMTEVQGLIVKACDQVKGLLIRKNKAYGNSALEPIRVFSKASTSEQLKVRIDDKLSRIQGGTGLEDVPEDTVDDLIGYLMLYKVWKMLQVVKAIPLPNVVVVKGGGES